ncbi:MAG: aromatic amino acid ammonia-lyase [Nocardioidaceae bacterium]
MSPVLLDRPGALDAATVLRVARAGAVPEIGPDLAAFVERRCASVRAALADGTPVYGVSTGMGAMSEQRLSAAEQAGQQRALLLARAVGGPPWLDADEARGVLAVRLRGFLNGDSGVSLDLCRRLLALLSAGVLPAVPRTGLGAAGEILALAHAAGPLVGIGSVLGPDGGTRDAGPALAAAGLSPLALGPKEGVALIEGVPVTTALAVLRAHDARVLLRQATVVAAAEAALLRASRDAYDDALARADAPLGEVLRDLRDLAGPEPAPRVLQPPVSFRVAGPVLAHLARCLDGLDAAVERALAGVTDSPAYVETAEGTGRFVGTAGFSGYDLAAHLHHLTVAMVGVAEVGAARLHRMLDPRSSGLPAQLSADPGPQAGLSPTHKRAVGVVHGLRRHALPATVGTVETSAGQEDVQSFSLEAAEATRATLDGLREVLACELLAVHQARLLGGRLPDSAGAALRAALDALAGVLPDTAQDRPFGVDIERIRAVLAAGWAFSAPGPRRDTAD